MKKIPSILISFILFLFLIGTSFADDTANTQYDSNSPDIEFSAVENGLKISFLGTYDLFSEVVSINWNDFPIYGMLTEKISSGEVIYEQTSKGVDIYFPLNESHDGLFDDMPEFSVTYSSGSTIYKHVIINSGTQAKGKLDVFIKAWDGVKWVIKWVRKALTPVIKKVTFSTAHARRHINKAECGFDGNWWTFYRIESKIKRDMKSRIKSANLADEPIRGMFPSITYNGKTIEYKPYHIDKKGTWNVGTYYCKK